MATLTRLASTLTARYFPSSSLTDAFYLDGRLCGKRETRQADITIDKDERGFFFSLFTHPTIEGFEPGTIPPFEPQLRGLCNEVKSGHKEIDAMIEKFLSTAVEVAGTTKLMDNEVRDPYFSGVIVRDSEAFAVTIGGGLAFLYRDDTMFPLTDAGIPMEPIDAYGNRVGDFQYYCSSKTANALWSNFFTLTPDDCIILCNKAIYDALGQREILRILTDAEDQCDAAGLILTQASARMPNTPMQISISFVESVTKEEKRGLFGRKKKKDDYDSESHEILESTVEGGMVGAAAKAIADAGFVSLTPDAPVVIPDTDDAPADGSISFGDKIQAEAQKIPDAAPEFPDKKEPVEELSAEDAMKKIFGEMKEAAQSDSAAVAKAEEAAAAESPFVFNIDDAAVSAEPKAAEPEKAPAMETVSKTEFTPDASDDSPTKPVTDINSLLFSAGGSGILAQAINDSNKGVVKETKISDLKEETVVPVAAPAAPVIPVAPVVAPAAPVAPVIPEAPAVVPPAPAVVNKPEEIVFAPGEVKVDAGSSDVTASAEDTFDPYGKNSAQELKNTAPLVFGEDVAPKAEPVPSEEVSSIPVPEYEINEDKPELKEEDKLDVDFPEVEKPEVKAPEAPVAAPEAPAAPIIEEVIPQAAVVAPSQDDIILPFGEATFATGAEEGPKAKADDIPQMPLYDSDNYNNPVNAVGSEQNISEPFNNASVYGDYAGTETPSEVPPYQPYGAEAFSTADQSSYGSYGYGNQTVDMQGGVPMDNNGYPEYGNAGNGYVPGYDQAPQNGFGEYPQEGYQQQDPNAGQYYQQDVPQGGYNDYSAQPQQGFGDEYAQPQASASSSSSLDEEWFNNILGVDDSGQVFGGEQTFGYSSAPAEPQPSAMPDPVQQAQYTNPGQTSYRPSGAGPNNNSKPQSSAPRSTAPAAGKSGNGGNGGGKKMKLNRNGYMFIAFLAILVICIIVVISLIAKGCSKGKKPVESSVPSETETSEIITTTTTTQATLPDPSAPIGYFCFSEYIGYRTWWDVFHYVYNIDIKDNSDQRIAKIITYNKLDPSSYSGPNPGDKLLLPPLGVITGEIPMTWNAGGTSTGGDTSATTTTQAEVNSSIHLT
ncbi:MAG: hypothetical protein IKZ42_00350 [Clostridiales bacterium]|nr:hypothetical protein [Clostridiales bacterium]